MTLGLSAVVVPRRLASEEMGAEVSGEPERIIKIFHFKSMWTLVPIGGLTLQSFVTLKLNECRRVWLGYTRDISLRGCLSCHLNSHMNVKCCDFKKALIESDSTHDESHDI